MTDQTEFECWIDVPGTDGRFEASNRGRLRMIGKKVRHCRKTHVVLEIAVRGLVCDYKTGRLGWWVYFDGEKRFFARDELVALFPERFRDVDTSRDEELRRLREETFDSSFADGGGGDES